jgi:phenylacetate-coenzyme A ligase PaaK-like adenylate-forming protein
LRQLKDHAFGYKRFPAYDVSAQAMRRAGKELQKSNADCVIGYSVALDRLARVHQGDGLSLEKEPKAVIASAESFPFDDSKDLLASVLKAPVAMEYGTVETRLIAHTVPDGGYSAFWLNYFLEALDQGPSGGYILRLTSLYPRCFPLIRYEIGDEIEVDRPGIGITSFKRVIGRCNDYIELENGLKIHSEAVTHCLSGFAAISGYQMVQQADGLKLKLTLRDDLGRAGKESIRESLIKIHQSLSIVEIEVVKALEQTATGKTPMVIRRD